MANHVMEVTDANFEQEVLGSDVPVLVDFWATWCGPCRALAPTVEALAGEYVGKVKVCKVDVDGSPNAAARFGIRSIPTLMFFKNGERKDQLVGNVPRNAIEETLQRVM